MEGQRLVSRDRSGTHLRPRREHRPDPWWDGEIIGSWGTTPDGQIITKALADRGAEAHTAIDHAATELHARLDGTVITPAVRTPLAHALATQ